MELQWTMAFGIFILGKGYGFLTWARESLETCESHIFGSKYPSF